MEKFRSPGPAAIAAAAMIIAILPSFAAAQERPAQFPADPKIEAALTEISAQRIQLDIEKLVNFQTRSTLSFQDSDSRGVGAARDWIKAEFERYSKECGGCLEVKTDGFLESPGERIPRPTPITNVYAVLNGSDPASRTRIVLVTGHYDSRNSNVLDVSGAAPGANDDASGTAVSLECARVLSKLKFPATIIFLAVAGEEQGLNGSRHFAGMAKSVGWNIEAALNNDIVGGDRSPQQNTNVVRVFSEGLPLAASQSQAKLIRNLGAENDSASRELARYVVEVGRVYHSSIQPLLMFRPDRFLRGGDQRSFNEQGFAAVRFTEYREDYNHQHQNVRTENGIEYGDLPKFVNFDYVADVARLNAATLACLAAGPAPPANVHLLTKELENTSTLTWEASPDNRAKTYEVLWRATSGAYWEHNESAGTALRITLPLSKDNVVFAVRAIDGGGHRSLPVTPTPEQ
ncbi:MAG: M20/M25/M40 family metallo-hydrolase [Acidobacteriales bacterium]|nr:M20/M25/M40 family metallo-hydrolase [Terriglobales bacterium]